MNEEKIIKVLVSCPSDVQYEVKIIDKICNQLSTIPRIQTNTEINVYSYWLGNLTTPRITGERPQDIINSDIEKLDPDIFIGIMWNKFGNPQENNIRPTEEEFNIALDNYKKNRKPLIQFYFKNKPITLNTPYDCEQRKFVLKFKARLSKLGVYSSFIDVFKFPEDFTENSFEKQITNCIEFFFENFDELTFLQEIKKINKYKFKELKSYIPRRVYDLQDEDKFYLIEPEKYSKELVNLIQKEKKIVLLGDAGTGKTFELQRVAQYFSDDDKPLNPIYSSLNLHVDENLENYLPAEWKEYTENPQIDENHLLIILDGFDEVKDKIIARRKILAFCEKHPDVHFLISCRSNFYKTETKDGSGTLNNFLSYSLLGLTKSQIIDYLINKLKSKRADKFINNIYSQKVYYLLEIPFYLINLVSYYTEKGTLPKSKAEIFKYLLEKRIKFDEHKYNEMELDQEKTRILNTLEKLALGMELLCKNQISLEEYHQIIPDKELKELIKYSTCWTNLKFEHNNFQEFLAANALSRLEFSKIKEIITFSPEYKQIIPSWTNTISFLFSILDNENPLLIKLKNWIVETQPNILLYAEPDKIEKPIRFEIFKNIFNFYKEKKLWINSQKYNPWDLVKFGESEDTINFLIAEISTKNPLISRKEAIYLIGFFSKLYSKNEIISRKLQAIIFKEDSLVYHAILTLSSLKIINEKEIEKIVQKYKKSEDDNIRYAVYRLINKYELNDKYIEVFLEGIKFTGKSFHKEDKSMNLGEMLQLEEGLASSKHIKSLEKIIEYFTKNFNDLDKGYIERSFEKIIINSTNMYNSNNDFIFERWFDFTNCLIERHYLQKYYKTIIKFFKKTNTLFKAFLKIYKTNKETRKEVILLSIFTNKEAVDFIIEEYEKGNLSNDFIISFQHYLWGYNAEFYKSLNNLLIEKFGERFKQKPQPDYEKQRKDRLERDIALLFDKKAFIGEVKLIFNKIGKIILSSDDLIKFDTDKWDNRYYSEIVYDTIIDLAKKDDINVKSAIKKINNLDWDWFTVSNIHKEMINEKYTPTKEQKKWIEHWCKANVNKVNYKTANHKKGNEYSRSLLSIYLVYFMNELNFSYNQDVMLDILSFVTTPESIDFIAKYVSHNKVSERVLLNLNDSIEIEEVLVNHINYCINNELNEILKYVYNYLLLYEKDNFKIKELRNFSLDAILGLADDYNKLKETLLAIEDDYKWIIIDRLVKSNIEIEFIEDYLLKTLKNENEDDAFEASEYLILLENNEGLKYYVNYIRKNKKFRYRYWKESPFNKLTNAKLIPALIDLLEIDFKENIVQDKYDSVYKYVTNALKSIALFSEKNYFKTKESIIKFITKNADVKNVNNLYYFLEDLETQFYVNKSDSIEIKEVVSKLKELKL